MCRFRRELTSRKFIGNNVKSFFSANTLLRGENCFIILSANLIYALWTKKMRKSIQEHSFFCWNFRQHFLPVNAIYKREFAKKISHVIQCWRHLLQIESELPERWRLFHQLWFYLRNSRWENYTALITKTTGTVSSRISPSRTNRSGRNFFVVFLRSFCRYGTLEDLCDKKFAEKTVHE